MFMNDFVCTHYIDYYCKNNFKMLQKCNNNKLYNIDHKWRRLKQVLRCLQTAGEISVC